MGLSFAGAARVGAGAVLVLALLTLFGVSGAGADVQHGIGFQKGCESPTKVGDPVFCQYLVANNNFTNESLDTVTFDFIADVTHAASGDTPETNILANLELFVVSGGATCTAASGTGTFADPWIGVTKCTLPGGNVLTGGGSSIASKDHAGYVVQPADYNLPNHQLNDDAKLHWVDTCDKAPANCNSNQQTQTAPSATIVIRRGSQTATDIHNGQHQVVTTVAVGTTVHDFITVSTSDPDPNNPIPHGGNVFLEWFENGTCVGTATASATVGPVDATGHFDATGFPQTPTIAGHYAFRAHYLGDGTYDASDGPCEPLTVVDANIQITPNGTNRVGATHTFTATVNVNGGNGFTTAPDGTQVTFTIDSDTASSQPNPPTSCVTVGGSCTTSISSLTTGVTVVSAHTTLSVGGVTLTRHTDSTHGSSGPATKTWVNAKIAITPDGTNRVGAPHTFTVTLMKDLGDGAGFVAFSGAHVDFTLTNSNGAAAALNAAASSCDDAGPNTDGNGKCTIVFTSSSTGKVTGNASWTGTLGTPTPFTVSTDGVAPNSGPAVKTFVDAKIAISPDATNRIGAPHTFTVTLSKDLGDGAGFVAFAGAHVDFTLTNTNGANAVLNAAASTCDDAGPNTDGNGQCTIVFTSNSAGKVTGNATWTGALGTPSNFTVSTNGVAPNSGPAVKTFVDAKIAITPDATNRVGAAHTFTVTLLKNIGDGNGYVAFAGAHVNFTLTDSNGAVSVLDAASSTCDDAGGNTDVNGQCTIVFTSNSAGKVTGNASWTGTLGTPSAFTVSTDGVAPNSGPAVKTFVDAKISITPDATNRIGAPHTFTVTLMKNIGDGNGFVAFAGADVDFTLTDSNGAASVLDAAASTCDDAGANTDVNGQCKITFTSNSAGKVTGNASWTGSLGTTSNFTVSTNGVSPNSGPAVKTFVDAKIAITPDATNRVGAPHTFTVTLMKNIGDGNGFVAFSGAHVGFSLTDSNGASSVLNPAASTCDDAGANTDSNGQCLIVFTSNSAGKVTGNASWTGTLGTPSAFTVSTNGVAPNSGPAVKTFVDAKIAITPDATNEVGHPHTFTVTLLKNLGDGAGFVAFAGAHVDFTLTNSNGAASALDAGASTCDNAGANTDAAGQCTIVFTSNSAGKVTGNASWTGALGTGSNFTVSTNGVAPNSGPAVKTFVDANIEITPQTATNPVNTEHTLLGHVRINDGSGPAFTDAPDGTVINFALQNSGGASAAFVGPSNCTVVNGLGSCTVVIKSSTTGTTTIKALTTLSVGGVSLHRETGDQHVGDSVDAIKNWANATIAIAPDATNRVGAPHTFTVTLQKDSGNGQGFVAAAGEHVHVALTDSNGAVHTAPSGSCTTAGPNTDAAGHCTITFTSNSAGKVTAHASSTLSVAGSAAFTVETDGIAPNSGDAAKTFVDAEIEITPDATNRVGASHTFAVVLRKNLGDGAGFVAFSGAHVGFSLTDSNGAASVLDAAASTCDDAGPNTDGNGKCLIVFTSNATGKVTGNASWTGTLGTPSAFTVSTNGVAPNTGPAVKTFVNARIKIVPDATNLVTQSHTFEVTLEKDVGDGNGFVAAAGEHVTVTLTDSNGATHTAPTGSCTTAGANTNAAGKCEITFTSNTAGTVTGHASSSVSLAGSAAFTVETDGIAPNSVDAKKTFVKAKIEITPDATNEVGKPHTFTVTLQKDSGNGQGFVAAADEHVTVTLTDSNGATHSAPSGSCTTAGANTNASGQCTVTFTSNTSGKVTGHASSTLSVFGSAPFTVATDGVAPNSGDALKTFVDANIQITPATANNPVSTNHTLVGHVNVNLGNGGGFVNAPNGTALSFSLTNSGGATAAFVGPSSCSVANGLGSCSVVISSSTTGTTTVKATTTVVVGGVSLTRATGDAKAGDSADASKTWSDDTVRTDVHNAAHQVITTTVAGAVIHDNVQVARAAGTPTSVPNPTGSVIFHRYATINCTGAVVNQTVALTPGSPSTAESDAFAPTADMSYQAEYLGDANYPAHLGACEPLTVSPAPAPGIAIVKNPKSQTVAVGGTATFSITVTNTGNVTLTDVHVVDPLSPNCNRTKADIPALASMAPGAAVTYSCTRPNVRSAFDNVATAIGTPPSGPDVTATDTAPVKTRALVPKKPVKKKPKIVSHKRPKATG